VCPADRRILNTTGEYSNVVTNMGKGFEVGQLSLFLDGNQAHFFYITFAFTYCSGVTLYPDVTKAILEKLGLGLDNPVSMVFSKLLVKEHVFKERSMTSILGILNSSEFLSCIQQ
jgi:hypothetical protein